jgi:hypothetical protein
MGCTEMTIIPKITIGSREPRLHIVLLVEARNESIGDVLKLVWSKRITSILFTLETLLTLFSRTNMHRSDPQLLM